MYNLLFLLFLPILAAAENADLDSIVNKYVKEKNFQGTVLVEKQGQILYNKTNGQGLNEKTLFGIGSVSKQFTAAGILVLKEERLLDLHKHISEYFDVPAHWKDITIHHLLTHSSGIVRDIPMGKEDFYKFHSTQELLEIIKKSPLMDGAIPGKQYSYSNSGYTVLAALIEKVSGLSFKDFMKQRLFIPAGLLNTGLIEGEIIPNLAPQIIRNNGEVYPFESLTYFSNFAGSGNVFSTIADMVVWMRFLRTKGFLSEESWKDILSRHIVSYAGPKYYGYGWIIEDFKDQEAIWHNGTLGGYRSDISYLVKDDLFTIILSNVRDTTWDLGSMSYELVTEAIKIIRND